MSDLEAMIQEIDKKDQIIEDQERMIAALQAQTKDQEGRIRFLRDKVADLHHQLVEARETIWHLKGKDE